MTTGATGQLGLALPVQGELSGTWGDTVNNGLTQYANIAIAATLTLTGDGAVTLANTTGDASASNITSTLAGAGTVTAQFAMVRVSGTTVAKTVTGPSYSKSYIIDNASSFSVTFKASGQTGVSISPGEKVGVYYNGTDYVKIGGGGITYGAVKTTTYTAVSNDGVLTDTTGGAFTVTLPATPATGTQVFIADSAGTWGTNNLTIGRNGSTIEGSATDLVCDINSVSIQCVYNGTTWDIFAQIGANDTAVVTLNGTQTLTNKTLTAPVLTAPVLGTPASGTVTNLTGTASININGTVGATTPAAGAFTSLTASTTLGVTGVSTLTGGAVIQGLTVGRGAGAVATNTAVGASALAANTSGAYNTAIGYTALYSNQGGSFNTSVGRESMYNNTSGNANAVLGMNALYTNTTGSNNIAVGQNALNLNLTGSYNSALGFEALKSNTTASNNTAVGYQAGYSNSTGTANTFLGTQAGYPNTTGSYNVAIGQNSLASNTTASYNTAVGNQSLFSNTTASDNTAVGFQSMFNTTTGYANVAIGETSLRANTTGYYNASVGYNSLSNNTTAVGNAACGMAAGTAITTGGGNSLLGYNAGANITTGASNVCLGQSTGVGTGFGLFNLTTQNDRIIIGSGNTTNAYVQVAWTVVSDLRDKIVLGDVPHGLDFVRKLKPIKYQFKESRESNTPHGVVKYGFGAQDVLAEEGDNPVIVDTEQLEKLKITDSHMMPVFANAIKEMADMIDQLKAEIAALKGA